MKITAPFLILTALFLFPSAAAACLCDSSQTVTKAFREAGAVATAKYIGSEYRKGIKSESVELHSETLGKKLEYEVLVQKFEVTHWWKGGVGSELIVVSDKARLADGTEMVSDCGLGFEEGKSYLIYAYSEDGHFYTGVCTRTKSIKRADADLRALKKLTS